MWQGPWGRHLTGRQRIRVPSPACFYRLQSLPGSVNLNRADSLQHLNNVSALSHSLIEPPFQGIQLGQHTLAGCHPVEILNLPIDVDRCLPEPACLGWIALIMLDGG